MVLEVQLTGHADLWGKERSIKILSRSLAGQFIRGEQNGPCDGRVDRLAESPGVLVWGNDCAWGSHQNGYISDIVEVDRWESPLML